MRRPRLPAQRQGASRTHPTSARTTAGGPSSSTAAARPHECHDSSGCARARVAQAKRFQNPKCALFSAAELSCGRSGALECGTWPHHRTTATHLGAAFDAEAAVTHGAFDCIAAVGLGDADAAARAGPAACGFHGGLGESHVARSRSLVLRACTARVQPGMRPAELVAAAAARKRRSSHAATGDKGAALGAVSQGRVGAQGIESLKAPHKICALLALRCENGPYTLWRDRSSANILLWCLSIRICVRTEGATKLGLARYDLTTKPREKALLVKLVAARKRTPPAVSMFEAYLAVECIR